jgi:uncharacterized protein (UPF0147 family)
MTEKLMEHKKKRADNLQGVPATVPALAAHLEMFAKAVAEGDSHVEAAVICGRKRGSASFLYAQPGVKERIAELKTIARDATEKAIVNNAAKLSGAVDIDRNEIINILTEIARDPQQPGRVRVYAANVLSKIFMLQPKNLKDLKSFYGWTSDELEEYGETGEIPVRIRQLFGEGGTEAPRA